MMRALQGYPILDFHVKATTDKKLQQSKWQYDVRFRRQQNISREEPPKRKNESCWLRTRYVTLLFGNIIVCNILTRTKA